MMLRRRLPVRLVAPAVVLASSLAVNARTEGAITRLTTSGQNFSPVFSPDGRQIAFFSTTAGRPDVVVMAADGSDRRVLTSGVQFVFFTSNLAWSPDGKRILFVAAVDGAWDAPADVYVVAADATGAPVNLTRLPTASDATNRTWSPEWSPDGRHIVFARGTEIWVMDGDGSNATNLSSPAVNDPHDCSQAMEDSSPTWSPNGREIAFLRVCGIANQETHLYVMKADGSDTAMLSLEHGYDHWDPAWSPNGQYISMASALHAEQGSILVIVRKDGTETNVSQSVPSFGPAVWSPDGRRLAFIGSSGNVPYLVNADSSRLAPLLDAASVSSPSWSRNGLSLAFQLTVSDNQVWYSDIYVVSVAAGNAPPR